MSSTDPFEGQHHSPFYIVMFLVFVMPILFVMTVWERFGCSKLFEPKEPEVTTKWDVNVRNEGIPTSCRSR